MDQPYRTHAHISKDGTLVLSNLPFAAGDRVVVTVRAEPSVQEQPAPGDDALAVLELLIGTIEAPSEGCQARSLICTAPESEMREDYDFSPEDLRNGIRGQFAARFTAGVNLVPIKPNLKESSPDAEAVNQAEAAHLHGRVDSSLVPRSE
jgi:hypothetical protein